LEVGAPNLLIHEHTLASLCSFYATICIGFRTWARNGSQICRNTGIAKGFSNAVSQKSAVKAVDGREARQYQRVIIDVPWSGSVLNLSERARAMGSVLHLSAWLGDGCDVLINATLNRDMEAIDSTLGAEVGVESRGWRLCLCGWTAAALCGGLVP
jgi:hypothetical protein